MRTRRNFLPYFVLSVGTVVSIAVGFSAFVVYKDGTAQIRPLTVQLGKPVVAVIGDRKFTDIGYAISQSKAGDVVEVLPRGLKSENSLRFQYGNYEINVPAGYRVPSEYAGLAKAGSLVIPSGVTLLISYDQGTYSSKKGVNSGTHVFDNPDSYRTSLVTVGDGVALENFGSIEVGGVLRAGPSGSKTGSTGGKFAELSLGIGSSLINHGNLNVYGLIDEKTKGTAMISHEKAGDFRPSLGIPLVWNDFGGGSALKAIYDDVSWSKCLPLDDFYFENIRTPSYIYSGTTVTSWINLYAADTAAEYDLLLISPETSGSIISLADEGSYIYSDFDSADPLYGNPVHTLHFYGGASFNELTIDVKQAIVDTAGILAWAIANAAGIPESVTTRSGYFPICHVYQITLDGLNGGHSEYKGDANSYKFLSNSSLNITSDASLTCTSLIAYDDTDILSDRASHAANLKKSILGTQYDGSSVIVDGKLEAQTVAGKIGSSKSGGEILVTGNTSATMYEPKNGEGSNTSAVMYPVADGGWYVLNFDLELMDESGTLTPRDTSGYYDSFENEVGGKQNFYWELTAETISLTLSIWCDNPDLKTEKNTEETFVLRALVDAQGLDGLTPQFSWSLPDGLSFVDGTSSSDEVVHVHVPAQDGGQDMDYSVSCTVTYYPEGSDPVEDTASVQLTAVGCFVEGTMIKMSDGSEKPIESVLPDDSVLSFDHSLGTFVARRILYKVSYGLREANLVSLKFENSEIEIAEAHGFFDFDSEKYVVIRPDNVAAYLNHRFLCQGPDGKPILSRLISFETKREKKRLYSLISENVFNHIANSIVSVTPAFAKDYLINLWPFDGIRCSEKTKEKCLSECGLYKYDDWKWLVSEKFFYAINGPEMKAAVFRKLISEDQIVSLVEGLRRFRNAGIDSFGSGLDPDSIF